MKESPNYAAGIRDERDLIKLKKSRENKDQDHGTFTEQKHQRPAAAQHTLLVRNASAACILTLLVYISLQYFIFLNHFGPDPVCNDNAQYSTVAKYTALFAFLCFSVSIVIQVYLIISENMIFSKSSMFSLYATTLTINLIAGSSSYLTYMYNWGGVCKDSFGVVTPAAQWPEWVTSVPFLVFITLAIDSNKKNLAFIDYFVIVGMAICIGLGWALQLQLPGVWSTTILIISNLAIVSTVFLVHRSQSGFDTDFAVIGLATYHNKSENSNVTEKTEISASTERAVREISDEVRMKTLSYLLFVIFPLFPLIYLSAMLGALDYNWTYICFQFAGLAAKLLFAALAVRSHQNVLDQVVKLLEDEIQPMIQNIITGIHINNLSHLAPRFLILILNLCVVCANCFRNKHIAIDIEDWGKDREENSRIIDIPKK